MNTRRQFLITAPMGMLAATAGCGGQAPSSPAPASTTTMSPPPTPRGAARLRHRARPGPPVSPATFAEAEKLVQVTHAPGASADWPPASWRRSLAPLLERRTGPRKVALDADVAPATRVDPGRCRQPSAARPRSLRPQPQPGHGPLPASDEDIAFAPVTQLSRWIETRQLTSERLTRIYLDRIERFDPKLRCVITLTRIWRWRRRSRPTRRSPPASTAARCTASRGA